MNVIIGLGNPGSEYARTRHNIGFMTVDRFLSEHCEPARAKKTPEYALVKTTCGGTAVAVLKPMLFMNLSGQAVSKAPFNFQGRHDSMLVIFDDVSLDFGKLRFREKGRSGGHKGVQNIIDVLGATDFHRLRIGIGSNRDVPLIDYVLGVFSGEDRLLLPEIVDRAAKAITFYLENGIAGAMNKYNPGNVADKSSQE